MSTALGFVLGATAALGGVLLFGRLRRGRTPPRPAPVVVRTSQHLETVAEQTGTELADLATGIEGNAQLLCEVASDPAMIPCRAEDLWINLRRLRLFSDKILSFARQPELDLAATDVHGVLEDLRPLLQELFGPGLHVELTAAAALPQAIAEERALHQALVFLAETLLDLEPDAAVISLRASTHVDDENEPAVVIELHAESEDGAARHGTPDHRLQLDYGAARNLLYGQGGNLSLAHSPGWSATASFTLKAAPAAIGTAPPAPTRADADPHPFGGVLILEHDPSVRMMITEALSDSGRHVVSCSDGAAAQALLAATAERFELLILQAEAPRGAGDGLALAALERDPRVKVLLLTHQPGRLGVPERYRPRFTELPKPFDLHQLRACTASLLGTAGPGVTAPA